MEEAVFASNSESSFFAGCATVAEVRKRGEEFWDEFEFYLSDMLVGLVMDVVLVSLLAPVAVAGRQRKVPQNALRRWSSQLPSAVFEKSTDKKYTISDRFGCFIARGLEYSLAGIVCGFVGQGIASGLMVAKCVIFIPLIYRLKNFLNTCEHVRCRPYRTYILQEKLCWIQRRRS